MKKILLISLVTISAFSQTSNIFEPIDVFDLEYVSNPQISPSGDKVLYQRNFNDIMTDQSFSNIWLIDYDGNNNRPITTGNFKDNSPKWSNQGDKFLFKSNREGKSQIFLFDLNNNSNFAYLALINSHHPTGICGIIQKEKSFTNLINFPILKKNTSRMECFDISCENNQVAIAFNKIFRHLFPKWSFFLGLKIMFGLSP